MRTIMLAAVLSAVAFPMSASAHTGLSNSSICQTKTCEKRVHVKHAQACATKACKRRACSSTTCRDRVAEKRWKRLQASLSVSVKATLARLRGCETRGIPFPKNYQWKGHHRGAYQYLKSTWARAGGSGDPADASPAEQDVRTARFYPGHRSEWACSG